MKLYKGIGINHDSLKGVIEIEVYRKYTLDKIIMDFSFTTMRERPDEIEYFIAAVFLAMNCIMSGNQILLIRGKKIEIERVEGR